MRLYLLASLFLPLTVLGQNGSDMSFDDVNTVQFSSLYEQTSASDDFKSADIDFGFEEIAPTVKIHPNPSSRDLYVTLKGNGENGKVVVYDILGNVVIEGKSFSLAGGEATWSHNVADWHTGTYVVRILHDDKVVKSLRFIKN